MKGTIASIDNTLHSQQIHHNCNCLYTKMGRSQTDIAHVTTLFLYESSFTRFKCSLNINYDPSTNFINDVINFINDIMNNYITKHKCSTLYYPQSNKQVEYANKTLFTMIMKMVNTNNNVRDECLVSTYWITYYKVTIRYTPFNLKFGTQLLFPTNWSCLHFKHCPLRTIEWNVYSRLELKLKQTKRMERSSPNKSNCTPYHIMFLYPQNTNPKKVLKRWSNLVLSTWILH